jgi:hypothetical protein
MKLDIRSGSTGGNMKLDCKSNFNKNKAINYLIAFFLLNKILLFLIKLEIINFETFYIIITSILVLYSRMWEKKNSKKLLLVHLKIACRTILNWLMIYPWKENREYSKKLKKCFKNVMIH